MFCLKSSETSRKNWGVQNRGGELWGGKVKIANSHDFLDEISSGEIQCGEIFALKMLCGEISAAKFPAVKFSCGEIYFLEVHRENIYSMKLMLRNFRGKISAAKFPTAKLSVTKFLVVKFNVGKFSHWKCCAAKFPRQNFRGEISGGEIFLRRNIFSWSTPRKHLFDETNAAKFPRRSFRGEISDGEIICDEISSGEIQCGEIFALKMLCGEISSRRNIPSWNIKMHHVP